MFPTDSDSTGALHSAAHAGNYCCFKMLVEAGAELGHLDLHGNTLMHWAAAGGHIKYARLMVENGARVGVRAEMAGVTPMMCAAMVSAIGIPRYSSSYYQLSLSAFYS